MRLSKGRGRPRKQLALTKAQVQKNPTGFLPMDLYTADFKADMVNALVMLRKYDQLKTVTGPVHIGGNEFDVFVTVTRRPTKTKDKRKSV